MNAGAVFANTLVWRSGEEAWQVWANVAAVWANGNAEVPAVVEDAQPEPDALISADVGVDSVFGDAWKIFKRHWGKFLLTGLLLGVLSVAGETGHDVIDEMYPDSDAPIRGVLSVGVLLCSLLSGVLTCGYLKIARREDAGTRARLVDVFPLGRCLKKVFKYLGAGLVFVCIVLPVYLLMVAPILFGMALSDCGYEISSSGSFGLVAVSAVTLYGGFAALVALLVRLLFVYVFVFDTDCGVFAAFKASWRITRGRFWRTLGYGILTTLMVFFGSVFTLGLGAIILMPLSVLWFSVYYIKLCKTCEADVPASVFGAK